MSVISSQPKYAVLDEAPLPAGRVIVLVTEQDNEQPDSPSHIWSWAAEAGLQVLLLGLFTHPEEEASLRRHLVSMAAAIRDRRVFVEVRAEYGSDWVRVVRDLWRPGDILVCYEGDGVGIRQRPLDQVLRSNFDAPVYVLPVRPDAQPARSWAISKAVSWLGSIGVVVVFFLLQVRIVQWLHDWGQTALLSLSILAEVFIIWVWDSLTV